MSSWLIFDILFNIILQGSGTSIMHLVAWFCLNWLILIANLNCLKEQLKCYSDFHHLVPSIISLSGLKSQCVFYWKFFGGGEAWSTAQCTTHLTYHLVLRAIWPHYVKWNFSTFCGLSRSTTYLYLPQGRIGPFIPRSYPQGGVQIYPMANLLHKMWKQKYPPPNSDFWKNLTLAWFWPIIWHISNPEPSDTF